MNEEMKEEIRLMSSIDQALVKFNFGVEAQEKLTLKTSQRNSWIFRVVALLVLLLFSAMLFLTWSLKQHISTSNVAMTEMAKSISAMGNSMSQMQTSSRKMETGINQMVSYSESIANAMNQKDNSVVVLSDISDSVRRLQGGAEGLNQNIDTMNFNLGNIDKQMRSLNKKLGMMGQDVNRMSSSSKRMFPF